MLYDRKIKYVDYYENGERIKGAGFVKLEVRDSSLKMDLNIRGLYPTDSFVRDVVLKGPETEAVLGRISLQEGIGCFNFSCEVSQGIGSTGISYEELQEIKIPVGGNRELCCTWGKAVNRTAESIKQLEVEGAESETAESETADLESMAEVQIAAESEKTEAQEAEAQEAEAQEAEAQEAKVQEAEVQKAEVQEVKAQEAEVQEAEVQEAEVQKAEAQEAEIQEAPEQELQMSEGGEPQAEGGREQKPAVKLLEDKWQQLSAIYPHIRPFGDEREYLSLSPSDFVMFPESYYRAANNSFLLHGFYNYKHLVLARVEHRSEVRYYLGVPGNYYEREKQVAVMFGFESFECDREPAKTGDFGYYLMRMEL